jgi:ankyrin repeat protein
MNRVIHGLVFVAILTVLTCLFMGCTAAFFQSIRTGDLIAVQKYIKTDKSFLNNMQYGEVPLIEAIFYEKTDIIAFLISQGADVNNKNGNGITPLHAAVSMADLKTAKLLLENGAHFLTKDKFGFSPLNDASSRNESSLVKLFIENGADANTLSPLGTALLHNAAKSGDAELVAFLIDHGAMVDIRDHLEATPLHLSVERGALETVKLLVSKGADIQAKGNVNFGLFRSYSNRGCTPLHVAASAGQLQVAEFLITQKAAVNEKDDNGATPLHYAVFPGLNIFHKDQLKIVEYLLSHGAQINSTNNGGETPLHRASIQGNPEIVGFLVANGADIKARDINGKTPLDVAEAHSSRTVVDYLKPLESPSTSKTIASATTQGKPQSLDQTPPEIIIRSHNTEIQEIFVSGDTKHATISGQVKDSSGIVEIIVNGKDTPIGIDGYFKTNLFIAMGKNRIRVSAMDMLGNQAEKSFVITRKYAPTSEQTITQRPVTKQLNGWYDNQYALVVGIDQYARNDIERLENAANDARAVALMFNKLGFYVDSLYDQRATKKSILSSLAKMMKKVQRNDSFVFYFAGHGEGFTLENGERIGYILPSDVNVNLIEKEIIEFDTEAISLNTIKTYCKDVKAKHIALLFDSCFSGLAMKRRTSTVINATSEYYNDLLGSCPYKTYMLLASMSPSLCIIVKFNALLHMAAAEFPVHRRLHQSEVLFDTTLVFIQRQKSNGGPLDLLLVTGQVG